MSAVVACSRVWVGAGSKWLTAAVVSSRVWVGGSKWLTIPHEWLTLATDRPKLGVSAAGGRRLLC